MGNEKAQDETEIHFNIVQTLIFPSVSHTGDLMHKERVKSVSWTGSSPFAPHLLGGKGI